MKKFLLAGALLLTVACSPAIEVEPVDVSKFFSGAPKVVNAKQEGWQLGIATPQNVGQHFAVSEYYSSEAVHSWTVVPVVIKNSSDRRKSADEAFDLISSAVLMDSNGDLYERNIESFAYWGDTSKPFAAGESRQFILLFDTPEGATPKQLITDQYETVKSSTIDF